MTEGVSRRALGRRLGVHESTIRLALKDGRLGPALLADGTLDPVVAKRLLAGNLTRGAAASPALAESKLRRLRAAVALLADQVDEVRHGSVSLSDFLPEARATVVGTVRATRKAYRLAAPALDACPSGGEARRLADRITHDVLTHVAGPPVLDENGEAEVSTARAVQRSIERFRERAALTDTDEPKTFAALTVRSNELNAERKELALAMRTGRRRDYSELVDAAVVAPGALVRSLLVAASSLLIDHDERPWSQVFLAAVEEALGLWASEFVPATLFLETRKARK